MKLPLGVKSLQNITLEFFVTDIRLLTVGEDLEKEESRVEVGVQISLGALSNKHVLDGRGKGGV